SARSAARRARLPSDGALGTATREARVRPERVALSVAGAVVVVAAPWFVSNYHAYQLALVGIYFIALLGLNVLTGYSGQISLGHGAFMGIGAYTTAILTMHHGWNDVATIPVAGLVAGVGGYLFGLPALRLAGVYLALAT